MSKNYTKEETAFAVGEYVKAPTPETVARIAAKLRKKRRSVISKLSREGVYQKKVYLTKTGTLPESKTELVEEIENTLGRTYHQLDKAPKMALKDLRDSVVQLQNDFDVLMDEFDDISIRLAMYEKKFGGLK